MPRSYRGVRRTPSAPCAAVLHGLLQWHAHSLIVEQGRADITCRRGSRTHSVPSDLGRTASPICSGLICGSHRRPGVGRAPRFPEYAFEVDPPDPVAIQAQPERARKAESARSRPVPEGRGITRINVFLFGGDNPRQSTCAPPATARHDSQQYTPLAKTYPSFQS